MESHTIPPTDGSFLQPASTGTAVTDCQRCKADSRWDEIEKTEMDGYTGQLSSDFRRIEPFCRYHTLQGEPEQQRKYKGYLDTAKDIQTEAHKRQETLSLYTTQYEHIDDVLSNAILYSQSKEVKGEAMWGFIRESLPSFGKWMQDGGDRRNGTIHPQHAPLTALLKSLVTYKCTQSESERIFADRNSTGSVRCIKELNHFPTIEYKYRPAE